MSIVPSDVYARQLLPKQYGYPLFVPEPYDNLPQKYLEKGTCIGDVGIIKPNGSFCFVFNICTPADDYDINYYGVPESFEQVHLHDRDISILGTMHKQGSDVSSASVKKININVEASLQEHGVLNVPAGVNIGYSFTSASSEAAVLTLPEGAASLDLLDIATFRRHALKHTIHWYEFVNGVLGREAPNGSLYLVTGCDKSTTWGAASVSCVSETNSLSLKFTAAQLAEAHAAYTYSWETYCPATVRTGPQAGNSELRQNQSPFLRGFKLRVNMGMALKKRAKVSPIVGQKNADVLPGGKRHSIHFMGSGHELRPAKDSTQFGSAGGRQGASPKYSAVEDEMEEMSPSSDDVCLEFIPDTTEVYHPLNVINEYLITTNLTSEVVVTHESDWWPLSDKDKALPTDDQLINRLNSCYKPLLEFGGVSIVLQNMGQGKNHDLTSAPPYTEKQPVISSGRIDPLDQAPDGAYDCIACSTPLSTGVREELYGCNHTIQAEQRVSTGRCRTLGVDDRHQDYYTTRDSVDIDGPSYVQSKKLHIESPFAPSTTSYPNGNYDAEVGLSSAQLSHGRRRMLDLVNRLHSTGVQIDMDLPQIAVIGSQSAGKSSLINSLSGITVPRAAGTCTLCPTECRSSYANEDWKCVISLRFITDAKGQLLDQVRNDRFGPTIHNKAEVEERIRRAQRAILNPSTEAHHFLKGDDKDPEERQLTFSNNCVSLQISGRDVADFSFVDLPGLIANVGKDSNASDIELVKNLVESYIHKPSCLILLTVACETDFENQGAHRLAKLSDPDGKRTIGILTKPDRIPPGEEDRWLQFIRNESEPLQNGWYCVKQPSSKLLSEGVSWTEARTQENDYFSMIAPWSSLESTYQNHLRTSNLTERLSIILSDLISKRLPEIHEKLQYLLQKTETSIRQLPKPSSDPFAEVICLIGDFTSSLSRHVEGTPNEDGLLQYIRPAQLRFQRAIRETAPEFLPYERRDADKRSPPAAAFLANEEDSDEDEMDATNEKDTIYIDEVFERAQMARTRELSDNYPFVVQHAYISSITAQWQDPALHLFDAVHRVLSDQIKRDIVEHFGHLGRGGVLQSVQLVMTEHIKQCGDRTKERINWLTNVEMRPYTLNTRYYSDYRDKYLSFYRGYRDMGNNGQIMKDLQSYKPYVPNSYSSPTPAQKGMGQILSALPQIGITDTQTADPAKLFPPDPMEPALNIMAGVRAYFQVASKRFTDIVPMAIDHEFVFGVERDIQVTLLKGLGLSGQNGFKIARELIQEPHNIYARREELQKKLDRLNTARNELLQVGTSLFL